MSRWWVVGIAAATLCGLALGWSALRSEPVPVRVVAVEPGNVESTVTNTKAGAVRARRRAQLAPEIGGRVMEIAHREGARIEAGAVLVRLEDATQRAQLALAREGLRVAEAAQREACVRRDRARRELERKRELAERRIVSADVLDALESSAEAASAACNRATAEASRAQVQVDASAVELDKTVIRAPFAGVVAELGVEIGEWVTPSPPLLTAPAVVDIIDLTSLYISAPMDEVDSAAIAAGQRAKVTVDSHPDHTFSGSVVRVAPYVIDVEAQNRTVEIEVELGEAGSRESLLPGTSADVEVVLETRGPVLRIPTPALLEGNRVLVSENGTLAERSVRVGLKNWDFTEVTEGLREGERIVLSLDRVEVRAGAEVAPEEVHYTP